MRISIEGSIGVGKTTLLKRLSKELNLNVCLEPVEEWIAFLECFYQNPSRHAFALNLKVLGCFARPSDATLFERSPVSCMEVFTELSFENNHMTVIEMNAFEEVYEKIAWIPDAVVYLRATPEVCLDRIVKRDRESERLVSLGYLQKLYDKYECLSSRHSKVAIVDASLDEDAVYESAKKAVLSFLYPPTQLLDSK